MRVTKRHVMELSKVMRCIVSDAVQTYPTLRAEFERDLARLDQASMCRGVHTFTVDLPALGKHLDRCLSEGEYKRSGLPLGKRYSNRVVIPKLFRGLYLLIFEANGRLRDDCDSEALLFLRQLCYLGKKASLPCSRRQVVDTVNEFVYLDQSLPTPDNFWLRTCDASGDLGSFRGCSHSRYYQQKLDARSKEGNSTKELVEVLTMFDKLSIMVTTTLGPYRFEEWSFRHGPGAIAETTKKVNKYAFTNWSDRLEREFPLADCAFHSYSSWAGTLTTFKNKKRREIGSSDRGSRLCAVPKTFTKPRLIAAEPSEHQWCQQNIWHYFCDSVRHSWIGNFVKFNDQTYNQELCQRGSLDGSLSTIDLSAASDRVTCHLVGQMFRGNPQLLLALQACRTSWLQQDLSEEVPQTVLLRKFSTMGSAVTFPVESLIFLTVVLSSILVKRGMAPTRRSLEALLGQVAVFGDDLIVPTDCRELVTEALEIFDFKVNLDKSFWTGLFRESCGVDSYAGVNITPVYWKNLCRMTNPESIVSTMQVRNNFHRKFFLNTAAYLTSTVRRQGFKPVTTSIGSGICGAESFCGPDTSGHKTRVNPDLQRDEVSLRVPIGTVEKHAITDDSGYLQFFTERPDPSTHWESGYNLKPSLKLKRRWVPFSDLQAQEERKVDGGCQHG